MILYIVDYVTAKNKFISYFARCRLKSFFEYFIIFFNTIKVVNKVNSRDFV